VIEIAVTERPYLSIGEVLGLLLEEFSDVTISKIRFLESQGLIEPERTPSGYRKFYDADVERLRVILREQRENFLPLRVIRDRLEQGSIDPDSSGSITAPRGIRNVTIMTTSSTSYDYADDLSGEVERPHPDTVVTANHPAARPPVTGAVPVVAAAPPAEPVVTARAGDGAVGRVAEVDVPATRTQDVVAAPPAAGQAADARFDARSTTAVPPAAPAETPAVPAVPPVVSAVPQAVSVVPPPVSPAGVGDSGVRAVPGANVHDSFSAGELCSSTGVTADQLAELESYGLLAPRRGAGSARYTHVDAQIVRAAAGFLARGVEARHLRAWRQAVDREAALFDQLILPLMRQRNPTARQQAANTLNELSSLGGELRTALLQGALKHHFDS
jgi:DNA-binding transcriptional MerR regulator